MPASRVVTWRDDARRGFQFRLRIPDKNRHGNRPARRRLRGHRERYIVRWMAFDLPIYCVGSVRTVRFSPQEVASGEDYEDTNIVRVAQHQILGATRRHLDADRL